MSICPSVRRHALLRRINRLRRTSPSGNVREQLDMLSENVGPWFREAAQGNCGSLQVLDLCQGALAVSLWLQDPDRTERRLCLGAGGDQFTGRRWLERSLPLMSEDSLMRYDLVCSVLPELDVRRS